MHRTDLGKILLALFLLSCLISCVAPGANQGLVDLGRWSEAELAQTISRTRQIDSPGARIQAISADLLETPYLADSLIGGPQTAEQLVISLAGVDCFTYLDLVEALRRAADLADLPAQLKQVRYRDGVVAYEKRRHFFSDWVAGQSAKIADVTPLVGAGLAQKVVKQLNQKADATLWLAGIPVTTREIAYLPTHSIDLAVLSALREGDYVGIYSDMDGLDVNHTGVIVKVDDRILLRHASSLDSLKRVVDVDLLAYLQGKPGLVVYRVKDRD